MQQHEDVRQFVEGWCHVCCTQHAASTICPGEIRADGAASQSWAAVYWTPSGWEKYGVLLAPHRLVWFARVRTYPRSLWTVPGGSGAMKFVDTNRERAERKAVEFVRRHCEERGYQRLEDLPAHFQVKRDFGSDEISFDDQSTERPADKTRAIHTMRLRWGVERPNQEAETRDISAEGMFVISRQPALPGTNVKITLETDGCALPLRGRVAWIRTEPSSDRPSGMGITLLRPPALYVHYAKKLSAQQSQPVEACAG